MNYQQVCAKLEATRKHLSDAGDMKMDCAHRFELEPELRRAIEDEISAHSIRFDELVKAKMELSKQLADRKNPEYWAVIPPTFEFGCDIPERFECQNCWKTSFKDTGRPCECMEQSTEAEPWDFDMAVSINQ
jgi:hypothetical protein